MKPGVYTLAAVRSEQWGCCSQTFAIFLTAAEGLSHPPPRLCSLLIYISRLIACRSPVARDAFATLADPPSAPINTSSSTPKMIDLGSSG